MARRQAVIVAVAMIAFASIAAGFEHRPVQANTVDESDQVAEMLDAPALTPLVPARLLETRSGQPTGTIDGTVTHVERLGGDTNILAETPKGILTVRLFGQHPQKVGDTVTLGYDPAHVYRFAKDGRRLR